MAKLMVRIQDDIAPLVKQAAFFDARTVPAQVDQILRRHFYPGDYAKKPLVARTKAK